MPDWNASLASADPRMGSAGRAESGGASGNARARRCPDYGEETAKE